ncbi:MAG: response regulator [Ginsengibacter sp.]
MVLTGIVLVVICFIAFRYFYAGVSSVKLKNLELQHQVESMNKQLDLFAERERKATREADIAHNAKTKFLSSLSHDIRTPMNGVIGMANLLNDTNLNNDQKEYTTTILDCSTNLLSSVNEILINDMLEYSKMDSENDEISNSPFDIYNFLEEVLDMFATRAAESGVELLYHVDTNVPARIVADCKRLQKVLMNFVENSINATKQGEILISVKLGENADLKSLPISFTASDTGTGISSEKVPTLYKGILPENFSTKSREISKGFGLVISKRLVEQMGGTILLENHPGSGCSFTFTIVTEFSENSLPEFEDTRLSGSEGKQILIINKNAVATRFLSKQLEDWKFMPVNASCGEQALEILSQISVDLVLADANSLETGPLKITEEIKQKYPHLPVILIHSANDESYKISPELFSAVINKPVKRSILLDSIISATRLNKQKAGKSYSNLIPENFAKKYPLRILVAEDNPVNQKWIKKILGKIGYQCEIAENGNVVMEKVSFEKYDLVLMDVQMPEMDGLEATRMIRLCLEVQPVIIAMTANAMQGDREKCIQSGMNDYISKPVELHILLSMLEKWALFVQSKKELVSI